MSRDNYLLIRGQKVNHVLHLILTLVTVGLWGLIWIALVTLGGEERQMVQVDEWGNTSVAPGWGANVLGAP